LEGLTAIDHALILLLIASKVAVSETGGTMILVGRPEDIPFGEALRVEAGGEYGAPIAVFNVDGELLAIDDTCTHQDASLADGWLEGCAVECPLHAACFDLRTGMPSGPPAKMPVRTHEVVVEDGLVYVRVTAPVEAAA
jgi:3-phenylpropionate/trans-cinnamate dioxygenase ferredoxin subunit